MVNAAQTSVDICNLALAKIGQGKVASLGDGTKASDECQRVYNHCRLSLLRVHPWSFAKVLRELTAQFVPAFDYPHGYILPVDVISIAAIQNNAKPWIISEQNLLSHVPNKLRIVAIKNITDVALFDVLFSELLITKIALELCESITQSNTKKNALLSEYDTARDTAMLANMREGYTHVSNRSTWTEVMANTLQPYMATEYI